MRHESKPISRAKSTSPAFNRSLGIREVSWPILSVRMVAIIRRWENSECSLRLTPQSHQTLSVKYPLGYRPRSGRAGCALVTIPRARLAGPQSARGDGQPIDLCEPGASHSLRPTKPLFQVL